jgi:hypothetical protein
MNQTIGYNNSANGNNGKRSWWDRWNIFSSNTEDNNYSGENQGQYQSPNQNPNKSWSLFGGSRRRRRTKSKIDFSKIKWGSFTKKYNSYIKRHPRKKTNIPDLKHFAEYVNKNPKQFNKKTHKRALFYKNIILRKRK